MLTCISVQSLVAWNEQQNGELVVPDLLHSFDTGTELVFETAVSQDGTMLAAMLEHGVEIFSWSTNLSTIGQSMDRRSVIVIGAEDGAPASIGFGPRKLLAVGTEKGQLRLYNLQRPEEPVLLITIQLESSPAQALVWSPTGSALAVCCKSGACHVVHVDKAMQSATEPVPPHMCVQQVLASQGAAAIGTAVASASRARRNAVASVPQAKGCAWDESESHLYVLESTNNGGAALVKWSKGTPEQASGKPCSTVLTAGPAPQRVWFVTLVRKASRMPLTCMRGFTQEHTAGTPLRLLVGTSEGGVQCWSAAYLSLQWERPGLHEMPVSSVLPLAGGSVGVSASPDGHLIHFPLAAPKGESISTACWIMLIVIMLLMLAVSWLLLAQHGEKYLQFRGSEL